MQTDLVATSKGLLLTGHQKAIDYNFIDSMRGVFFDLAVTYSSSNDLAKAKTNLQSRMVEYETKLKETNERDYKIINAISALKNIIHDIEFAQFTRANVFR